MNAREAQRMLDKSREHPHLTAMVVPSPYGLTGAVFSHDRAAAAEAGITLYVTGARHFAH